MEGARCTKIGEAAIPGIFPLEPEANGHLIGMPSGVSVKCPELNRHFSFFFSPIAESNSPSIECGLCLKTCDKFSTP